MRTQKSWFSIQEENDQEESLTIPHEVDEFDYDEDDWEPDEDDLEDYDDEAIEDDWELDDC